MKIITMPNSIVVSNKYDNPCVFHRMTPEHTVIT
jgi:hypothetical protein